MKENLKENVNEKNHKRRYKSMNGKKLTKSLNDKMVCGVCSGLAKYFEVDVTLVRLAWVVVSLFSAGIGGLIAYVIAAIIMPDHE